MYQINYTDGFNVLADHWIGGNEAQYQLRLFYEDALSNHPYSGKQVPGTLLWALTLATRPQITIYYSIDEDAQAVTLHGLAEL